MAKPRPSTMPTKVGRASRTASPEFLQVAHRPYVCGMQDVEEKNGKRQPGPAESLAAAPLTTTSSQRARRSLRQQEKESLKVKGDLRMSSNSRVLFITDLLRVLVLLLAVQCFKDQDWGLNPKVDPEFGDRPQSHNMSLLDEQGGKVRLTLELSSNNRATHFGLDGRATNVFPATSMDVSREDGLVAQVFWAEETRKNEPHILNKVYQIAESNTDVKGHVPGTVCYQVLTDTSTAVIRRRLGVTTVGARVLCMLVFRKLKPITTLFGNDFLHAWWAAVKCHFVLWRNSVYHRNVSHSDLMFYMKGGMIMGVLNDFDLASIEDGPTGTERTGTIPFMALALLEDKAFRGEIKHEYEHDAESFIWVLIWISLRFGKGVLLEKDPPLDEWLKVDVRGCLEKKTHFLYGQQTRQLTAAEGHESNWQAARNCMQALRVLNVSRQFAEEPVDQVLEMDEAFQTLLHEPLASFLQ